MEPCFYVFLWDFSCLRCRPKIAARFLPMVACNTYWPIISRCVTSFQDLDEQDESQGGRSNYVNHIWFNRIIMIGLIAVFHVTGDRWKLSRLPNLGRHIAHRYNLISHPPTPASWKVFFKPALSGAWWQHLESWSFMLHGHAWQSTKLYGYQMTIVLTQMPCLDDPYTLFPQLEVTT
jgi:hypothetical protein